MPIDDDIYNTIILLIYSRKLEEINLIIISVTELCTMAMLSYIKV